MKEFYETLRLNDKNRRLSGTVLLFIIMLILPVSLMAQEKNISGRVIDAETNETLVGVSVVIKGTTTGTTTDIDGKFTLQAVPNSILVISYVGYVKQEISVGDQSDIMVQLAENAKLLDEVVVVGFGTQKKVNLTGAVGIATAKDFQDRPVMLAAQALQGLVPGLNISQTNGSLETRSSMSIRGKGSIDSGTNTSPLVLIDGIEGDINTLNPNDIENISVLKDAAASAIYGAKAPYGVILITTKKGVAGKTKVSYSNNFRWSKPILMPQQMDSYTFALYFNDACKDTPGWSPNFNDAWLQAIKDYQTGASRQSTVQSGNTWAEGFDPINSAGGVGGSANEDNYKNFFRSTGFSQEHNLSLSGGSDKVTYYVSGNFLDQKGLMQFNQDGYQRFSVNAKINFKVNKWVDFNYGNRFQRDTFHRPSAMSTSLFTDIGRQCWPIIPLYDPNGNLLSRWGLALRDGGTDKSETDNSYQQAQLVIEPIKNWKTYAEVNYSIYNIDRHWDQQTTYRYDVDGNPYAIGEPRGRDSSVHEESAKENLFGLNLYSEYSFSLDNRNNFKVMVGFQEQSMTQNKNGLTQYGIIFPSLPEIDLTNGLGYDGTAVAPTLNGERNAWATQGVFGRLNYDFEGKYLFEANLRYDVSSRYRTGHRGVVSPAFSAGWNIAQEDFFQPLKSVVDVLKLRVSYGQLANQNTTGWYPTYQNLGIYSSYGSWLQGGVRPNIVTSPGTLENPFMTWEKVITTNGGLDFSLLSNRLTGSFDYYVRKTTDMMGPSQARPAVLGVDPPKMNDTELKDYGYELSISWRDVLNNGLGYGVRLLLSDYQTKVTKYPSNSTGDLNTYYNGKKVGEIWGYETLGVAKTQQEMDAHLASLPNGGQTYISGSTWRAGDIMYADLNNDGKVDKGLNTLDDHGDLRVIGNTSPRYQFGIDLTADWKGFDVRAFFQGVMKRDFWQGSYFFWGARAGGNDGSNNSGTNGSSWQDGGMWWSTAFVDHEDYFRDASSYSVSTGALGENANAYYPRPNFENDRNLKVQSRYLQDASYIRLKNLQVGYTLPASTTRKFHIDKLRVFFSGENLWTGSKMNKMFDPETIGNGSYGSAYPLSAVYSFGINLNF